MRSRIGSFSFIFFSKQLQGSDEGRDEETQQGIHTPNMPKLIGVCKMATVPGQQEIALVVRRQGQVKRVTNGIIGHHMILYIDLNNICNSLRLRSYQSNSFHESQTLLLLWESASSELVQDSSAGYQLVTG